MLSTLKDMLSTTRAQLAAAASALVGLIIGGTIAYHIIERWSWIDSFYFAVTTITTVGYGDLTPSTEGSRLFTAFFVLAGVGIALTALTIIGSSFIQSEGRRFQKSLDDQRFRTPLSSKVEQRKKEMDSGKDEGPGPRRNSGEK